MIEERNLMFSEFRDLSKMSDTELKRRFIALSREQGKRLNEQMQQAQALIDALIEAYPGISEREILLAALEKRKVRRREVPYNDG